MNILKEIHKLWERVFDSDHQNHIESGYSYYAFISYTEQDEKWAEWLQWNLEHYKIPSKVRNEHRELPDRVRPVFWYKNDLAGAHLSGAIKKELEQSKYMIVVCSPASAKKDWVTDEVRYFKDNLGRDDRIIPFVVDGIMNSDNNNQECLPLPIRNLPRDKELRGIDVRQFGKKRALVNIVSTLFDLNFDTLWNRFKREQKRIFATYCTSIALLVLVLFGCWDYFFHTKYKYFVHLEDCNGLPTGIIQISNNEAKNHYRLYRFEYRKRKLQRVAYVDGDGNPQNHTITEFSDRPCILELSYNNGDLTTIECKDATQRTLYVMNYSKDKLAADLKDEDEDQAANFIFSSTSADQGQTIIQQSSYLDRLLKSPSKIARYVYERDDDGYITKKMFARHNGDNDDISMDANGISGFEYERDSLHRVIRIRFLDAQRGYKANNLEVAGKKYQYDKYGNLTVAEYVDKNGNLKYNEFHWARALDIYDSNGFCVEERVFGTDGKPCISAFGYHRMRLTTTKNTATFSFYDIHNNPTYTLPFGKSPGGYSIVTTIYNKQGQATEVQYKDANGNLCFNQHHVAVYSIEYDDTGLITDMRNYGPDRLPCSNIYGYFHEHCSYNHFGNQTDVSYYGVGEKPVHHNYGFHRIITKYDDTGRRMVELHSYNVENVPMKCSLLNGAAWIKLGYKGSSKWVSELSFFTFDNKPAETNAGAKLCCERDPYGQIIAFKYYNTDYKLSSNNTHSAITELTYNNKGMEIGRRYYDENKKPMLISGVFAISRTFTSTGQLETICYYDTLQHLTIGPEGWAVQEYNYMNGTISANSFYGVNRERIDINGVHKYVYEVDDCGYVLSQSAYNKNLQPAMNSQLSAHKLVYLYDDNRRIVGSNYYNTTDIKPFVCIRIKLNQRGLPTEQTAYNSKMELVESPLNYGVAKIQTQYDAYDRVTHICAFNSNGEKMNTSSGISEIFHSYQDNIKESIFLDSKNRLINNMVLAEPHAYGITYMTENGERIFCKFIKLALDNTIETIRDAYIYDSQNLHIQMAIRQEDGHIQVYEASSNQMIDYYSFDDEFDKYVHTIDSIQVSVELKYGKPKLDHYINK